MPGRVVLVEFPADDLDRVLRFWREVLSANLSPRTDEEGHGWQSHEGGAELGVHPRGPGPGDRVSLPYFSVPDLASALERVRANGGEVIHPGDRSAVCRDSEGSPFGLTQASPPPTGN